MITYIYDQEKDYIKASFSETINRLEIVNYMKSLILDNKLPKDLKVLILNENGTLKIKLSELKLILDENIKLLSHFNSLRVCIITKDLVDTALGIVYAHLIQQEQYEFQVFNTEKAGIAWLEVKQNKSSHRIYARDSIIRADVI